MSKMKGFQEGKNPKFSPGAKQTVYRLGEDHEPRRHLFCILHLSPNPLCSGQCRKGLPNDTTAGSTSPRIQTETKTGEKGNMGKTKQTGVVSYPI